MTISGALQTFAMVRAKKITAALQTIFRAAIAARADQKNCRGTCSRQSGGKPCATYYSIRLNLAAISEGSATDVKRYWAALETKAGSNRAEAYRSYIDSPDRLGPYALF